MSFLKYTVAISVIIVARWISAAAGQCTRLVSPARPPLWGMVLSVHGGGSAVELCARHKKSWPKFVSGTAAVHRPRRGKL